MNDKFISKGVIIYGSHQDHAHPTKSITISVSMDMGPTFKLLITVSNPFGELVADSVTVSVRSSINRYKLANLIGSSRVCLSRV